MIKNSKSEFDVFISYASENIDQTMAIVEHLENAGLTIWRDKDRILGGGNYGLQIVEGIKNAKVVLLFCSVASMRSRNVKQEIQLAWKYQKPYIPLLLDSFMKTGFPEQVEYWLEGCQWIELYERNPQEWLPLVLQSLLKLGVSGNEKNAIKKDFHNVKTVELNQGLAGLWRLAAFGNQIRPEPAGLTKRGHVLSRRRDLGETPDEAKYHFRLGDEVCLAIETERAGHLLLLDKGTSGKTYCLCPSRFAPETHLEIGCNYLPQSPPPFHAFQISAQSGREELLAIITDKPLEPDWMPNDGKIPARVLDGHDIENLIIKLHNLSSDQWTAISTYFDVLS